jgi:predicted nucleic acid-binding protein
MAVLFDTNILLRLAQKHHPHNAAAARALDLLLDQNEDIVVVPQVLVEFWAVASRPLNANGLGLTFENIAIEVEKTKNFLRLLPELPIHGEWLRLVTKYRVSGKNVHDARLVAAMAVHGIRQILTFNGPDFTRYAEVSVLDPVSLA